MNESIDSGVLDAPGQGLPASPYPGLRPFFQNEEALLFGRERQVREVIEKLQQTQFTAVIGGSGSGKSSLVLAAVVPRLRGFGIRSAGDFWVPMICTPGTNASTQDRAQQLNTPITRLARKFAALLKSRGSVEQDAARVTEIAARLREELGFATLIDLYTDELDAPPGPDPKQANFLIVIDQFEEIFHPTNQDSADARALVERVIDHFFSPHPRCYIVLTMRSEHLNDCAAFLELPDAINKSSYLVRRLDDHELREAITQPAQRLLRMRRIATEDEDRLPESVEFEPEVVDRLLRDVTDISEDPDHLPLLQHILARTWQAASLRTAGRWDMPDRVIAQDLAIAVAATQEAAQAPTLAERTHTLRASLENWAERAYRLHDAAGQAQLDALLPLLAVKDPNTGMYSQQRVYVDDCKTLAGQPTTREDLRRLVDIGFVGPLGYLFWDDDDPKRITLKVWHESLIRGWQRLRQTIDSETDRFTDFADVLHLCETWDDQGRTKQGLLSTRELRWLEHLGLDEVLESPRSRSNWLQRLEAMPSLNHLARLCQTDHTPAPPPSLLRRLAQVGRRRPKVAPDTVVANFLHQSRQHERGSRTLYRVLLGMAIFVLPLTFHFLFIQMPVQDRTELMIRANQRAAQVRQPVEMDAVGARVDDLRELMRSVRSFEQGRDGRGTGLDGVSQWLLAHAAVLPGIAGPAEFIRRVGEVSEPTINSRLRMLLETAVWADDGARPPPQAGAELRKETVAPHWASCTVTAPDGTQSSQEGMLYTAKIRNVSDENVQRARRILVPDHGSNLLASVNLKLHVIQMVGGRCQSIQELRPLPRLRQPRVVFDDTLRFMFVISRSVESTPRDIATLIELDGELLDKKGDRETRAIQRIGIVGPNDVKRLLEAHGKAQLLDSSPLPGGRLLKVGGSEWRLFERNAQRVESKEIHPRALVLPAATTSCGQLAERFKEQPRGDATFEVLVDSGGVQPPAHCFVVRRASNVASLLETVGVTVFAAPLDEDLKAGGEPALIAVMPRFTRVPKLGGNTPNPITWFIGTDPEDEGWLYAKFNSLSSQNYLASAPWSTCALYRLAADVVGHAPPDKAKPASASASAPQIEACRRGPDRVAAAR